jgi:hypothetical protein
MKKLLFIGSLVLLNINANATTALASTFGWNADDATHAFQEAINSSADTIIIDKQASDWIVGPNAFWDIQDKTIIFQPGVVFKAKTGAFPDNNDCLLKLIRANNIKIVGYGATFQMNKAEYAAMDDGEWRHSLAINNSSHVEVYGLVLNESGGDGVFISGSVDFGDPLYSEYIVLKDLWCNNQYRQGISICSAQHVLVQNCWFTNTSGTLPMSGVDLEPYADYQRMVDVVFEKCRFTGNFGNGIQLSLENLTTSSTPVDISFRDCYSSSNHDNSNPYAATEIIVAAASAKEPVTGYVKFERCMVENSQWRAVYMRKSADSFFTVFDDCVFLNVSKYAGDPDNTPIWIEVTDYSDPCPRFGGVAFNNCLLSYKTTLNLLGSRGNISTSPGMGNVQLNNLTVIHPKSSITINTTKGGGAPDSTCVFDYYKFKKAAITHVDFIADKSIVECSGESSVLRLTRIADTVNFPVGISYNLTGTALEGEDYVRMNRFMIIPANLFSQQDTLLVLKNDFPEEPESIDVTLVTSPLYTTTSLTQSITVSDCLTGINDITESQIFTVFPNPASDFIEIRSTDDFKAEIQVMNDKGQLILTQQMQGKVNRISIRGLVKGVYIINIQLDKRCYRQKIINL